MRILFLTHRLPYPPHKGDKIRALNVLKFLSQRHEVVLGCLIDASEDLKYLSSVRSLTRELVCESISPSLRRSFAVPLALLTSSSITVGCFYSRKLQRKIDELLDAQSVDAVLCYSSAMAEYVFRSRHAERLRAAKRVMDLIDIDSFKWRQYASQSAPWASWIYRHEARHLASYERRIAHEFDQLLVVSEQEKGYFPGNVGPGRLSAMSNGVDLEYFSPAYEGRVSLHGPALVFTGVMDYWPNVDGVRWFVERVFPDIRSTIADAQLYVVGSRPTADIQRLGRRPGVVITGFVEDVREYLVAASLCIVPLRVARGVQNKVLEAMAMGRAVITTRAAFEGIRAEPDRDLIVADSEAQFVAAAVELLNDPQRAARIGRNARACVAKSYSWPENLKLLDEVFPPTHPSSSVVANTLPSPLPVAAQER